MDVWNEGLCFTRNLAMLVNCCPIKEISIHRGMKKGGHVAHFIFVLVAEGLNGLISKAIDPNLFFSRVQVGSSKLVVSHL